MIFGLYLFRVIYKAFFLLRFKMASKRWRNVSEKMIERLLNEEDSQSDGDKVSGCSELEDRLDVEVDLLNKMCCSE